MALDTTHTDYDAYADQWQTLRDFAAGEDAVKAAGTRYLPMLGGHRESGGQARYAAYKTRAAFFNATGRTIDGLSGMIFRKEPMTEFPTAMAAFMDDVTLGDLDFQGFAESVVQEVLEPGRAGILVDFPRVEAGGMTQEQADRMNLRPFWSLYKTESIHNWRVGQIGNRTVLIQLRLFETVAETVDEFSSKTIEQYRVLDLDDAGHYRQRIYRKNDNGDWAQHGNDIYPEMAGQPIPYIPFVFCGPRDTTPAIAKPPLIDLAQVNASHYRTSADLEHGAHFTALPTPYRIGVRDADELTNEIGPESIWDIEQADASVGLLEFTGAGLQSLEARLDRKENQMASLGARMLSPEKRAAETAETASIHRQGEISVLASISLSVSTALRKALEMARDWMQMTGDVDVRLNTDFTPQGMDPRLFAEMLKAVQGGQLSGQEFFDALQQGEIVRADKTYDEHEEELASEGPALGLLGAGAA